MVLAALVLSPASASAITESARITWSPNSEPDLAGYVVRWGPLGGKPTSESYVGLNTTIVVDGLQRGWIYQFFVSAYNSSSLEGPPSQAVNYQAGPNAIPVALDSLVVTPEETPIPITLAGSDPDESPVTFAIITPPAFGTLSGTPPDLVYEPNLNFSGTDLFTFATFDGFAASIPATVQINVTAVNDAPTAIPSSVTTPEDSSLSITLNAADPDGLPLTYTITTPPTSGTLSGTPPNVVYTPFPNFNGADLFTFTVSDGLITTPATDVSITVTPVNDAPTAASFAVTVPEDGTVQVPLSGADLESTTVRFTVTQQPSFGTLTGTAPNLTYRPAANFNGTDSFSYVATDGSLISPQATVSITVTPVNDAPIALAATISGQRATPVPILLAGVDPENNPLTFTIVTPPTSGTLSGTPPSLIYTPNANFSGVDSLTFQVSDGSLSSAPATVSIDVTSGNRAPVAVAASVSTQEDTSVPILLSGTDPDLDALTYTLGQAPAFGTLSGTPPNLVYRPNTNYGGADSFTFTVSDGSLASAPATVSISVAAINDPPVATPGSRTLTEDGSVTFALSGTDVENSSLTFAVATPPQFGTLSGTSPTFTYTPNGNYAGPDSFTFTAFDGGRLSTPATFSLTVTPVNDAPVATPITRVISEDTSLPITLASTDPDGPAPTYLVLTSPAFGTLSGAAPNLTYTPNANYNGLDSFTYRASDGLLNSSAATVSISVTPVNDAPSALARSVSGVSNSPIPITLGGSDPEGSTLTFTVVSNPTSGTLSGTAPNLSYLPNPGFTGSDALTYTTSDGQLTSAPALVSITVLSGNRAPTASPASLSTAEDIALPVTLAGTDPDGNTLSFSVTTPPVFGTLSGTAPNLVYTPGTNYSGPDSFAFTVSDGSLTSAPASVTLTVTPVNDAPVPSSFSRSVLEDASLSVTLSATDVDSSSLTFAIVRSPASGTLSGPVPNLVYRPNTNFFGADSFTYTVSDGTTVSTQATVSITVTPVNDAPSALASAVSGLNTAPLRHRTEPLLPAEPGLFRLRLPELHRLRWPAHLRPGSRFHHRPLREPRTDRLTRLPLHGRGHRPACDPGRH
jgi:hypothetical protein